MKTKLVEALVKLIKAFGKLNFSCVCCAESSCNQKNNECDCEKNSDSIIYE